jgi:hypothetical protein
MADMDGIQAYIPLSVASVKHKLFSDPMTDSENSTGLSQISEMIEALWHHRLHERQKSLSAAYELLNPSLSSQNLDMRKKTDFLSVFEEVLEDGNWEEITKEEVDAALEGEDIFPISLDVRFEEFSTMRLFKLGVLTFEDERKTGFLGLKKQTVEIEAWDKVLQIISFKDSSWFETEGKKKYDPGEQGMGLHLRIFNNIPKLDLEVIFPNTTPNMRNVDKLKIAAPLIGGFVTLGMKFGPVLFGTGSGGTSISLIGGVLSALGTYILKSYLGYRKTKEKYLSQVSKDLYFKGQANDEAVMNMVIGLGEDQEVKEALLAYTFLHNKPNQPEEELDDAIELWLANHGVIVDFEVDDAVGKLEELGLLSKDGDKLSVSDISTTLSKLDEIWDNLYDY